MEGLKELSSSEEERFPLEVKDRVYRARFIAWLGLSKTSLFACSDGKNRYICSSKIEKGDELVL